MISDRIKNIKPSPTVQIAEKAIALKEAGKDIVDFSVGEPDFPTPEHIKKAAFNAIEQDRTKYTANSGLLELRQAICNKLKTENQLDYRVEQVLVSSGAKHALYNVMTSIIQKGDEVIIPAPYWGSYPEITHLAEGTPVIVSTSEDNGFHLTASQLEKAITDKTRVFILCNPVNPTGAAYNRNQLLQLAEILESKDILIIADEIYEKLLFDGKSFTSFASLGDRIKERTIIINGLSKAYAMTGWRVGYAAGPLEIIQAAAKVQSHSTSAASTISQHAAVAALSVPSVEMDIMVDEFECRRNFIVEKLRQIPGMKCNIPQGAFYVFPNVSGFFSKQDGNRNIRNSIDFADYILDEARVALVPGYGFGADDFIRISYSTSMQNIKEGVRRITEALGRL